MLMILHVCLFESQGFDTRETERQKDTFLLVIPCHSESLNCLGHQLASPSAAVKAGVTMVRTTKVSSVVQVPGEIEAAKNPDHGRLIIDQMSVGRV